MKAPNYPKFAGKYNSTSFQPKDVALTLGDHEPTRRVTAAEKAPSRMTPGGSTAKTADKKYTGTAMMGVATMHKSCQVPVFSQEQAIEVATMRR